jgi:hypothetical protein
MFPLVLKHSGLQVKPGPKTITLNYNFVLQ